MPSSSSNESDQHAQAETGSPHAQLGLPKTLARSHAHDPLMTTTVEQYDRAASDTQRMTNLIPTPRASSPSTRPEPMALASSDPDQTGSLQRSQQDCTNAAGIGFGRSALSKFDQYRTDNSPAVYGTDTSYHSDFPSHASASVPSSTSSAALSLLPNTPSMKRSIDFDKIPQVNVRQQPVSPQHAQLTLGHHIAKSPLQALAPERSVSTGPADRAPSVEPAGPRRPPNSWICYRAERSKQMKADGVTGLPQASICESAFRALTLCQHEVASFRDRWNTSQPDSVSQWDIVTLVEVVDAPASCTIVRAQSCGGSLTPRLLRLSRFAISQADPNCPFHMCLRVRFILPQNDRSCIHSWRSFTCQFPAKLIASQWREEPPEVKAHYERLAEQKKRQLFAAYPDYSYRPNRKHTSASEKRKVRGVNTGDQANGARPGARTDMPGEAPTSQTAAQSSPLFTSGSHAAHKSQAPETKPLLPRSISAQHVPQARPSPSPRLALPPAPEYSFLHDQGPGGHNFPPSSMLQRSHQELFNQRVWTMPPNASIGPSFMTPGSANQHGWFEAPHSAPAVVGSFRPYELQAPQAFQPYVDRDNAAHRLSPHQQVPSSAAPVMYASGPSYDYQWGQQPNLNPSNNHADTTSASPSSSNPYRPPSSSSFHR